MKTVSSMNRGPGGCSDSRRKKDRELSKEDKARVSARLRRPEKPSVEMMPRGSGSRRIVCLEAHNLERPGDDASGFFYDAFNRE